MRGAESLSQLDISTNNGTMTLSITTFGISALSITTLIMTQLDGLICENQHKRIECPGADCCNAECRVFIVRLNVVMPSVVMLSVIVPKQQRELVFLRPRVVSSTRSG
jgi:hypothetical protein